MTPYETLNIWLPENLPLYEKYKSIRYHQVDTGAYERDKTFQRAGISKREFIEIPALYSLIERYKMIPKIFMLLPNTTYNWHVDAFRYIAFNCLLTADDTDYLTLFCDELDKYDLVYFKTKRLVYEPRRFYLFNTQVPHIITNYSDKPRYLISIAPYFSDKISIDNIKATDRDFTTYLKVVEELKNLQLVG